MIAEKESLNTLNVPHVVSAKDSLSSGTGEDLRAALQQMAASLALWHRVTEARLHTLSSAGSAVNAKVPVILLYFILLCVKGRSVGGCLS